MKISPQINATLFLQMFIDYDFFWSKQTAKTVKKDLTIPVANVTVGRISRKIAHVVNILVSRIISAGITNHDNQLP